MTALATFPVCRLCFKQHEGPCQSFQAQQLRAKGILKVGQDIAPISLACPQCAAKDAKIIDLEQRLSAYADPYILNAEPVPTNVPRETLPPKMTQSERMKEIWRKRKEARQ